MMSAPGRIVWRAADKQGLGESRVYSAELNKIGRHSIDQFLDLKRFNIKNPSQLEFRYWAIVLLLTLVAAYLILGRQRQGVKQDA